MMSFLIPAHAGDHRWFIRHIKPSGQCSSGSREVAATYYGAEAGHRTASGERFRPNGHTAASWEYPLGTVISVVNPRNGRSVSVKINDRGPAKHLYRMGIKIDLSYGAAKTIRLGQNGRFESGYVCLPSKLQEAFLSSKRSPKHRVSVQQTVNMP